MAIAVEGGTGAGEPHPPAEMPAAQPDGSRAARRAAAGRQTRGSAYKQLVPDHKQVVHLQLTADEDTRFRVHGRFKETKRVAEQLLPVGSKRLPLDSPSVQQGVVGGDGLVPAKFGVPWTPFEFLAQAKQLQHPFDAHEFVAQSVQAAV